MAMRIRYAVKATTRDEVFWLQDTCAGGTFSEVDDDAVTFDTEAEVLAALTVADMDAGPRGAVLEVVRVVEVNRLSVQRG